MRFPAGRIGLWSIDHGEFADCVSRGLRLYPCIDALVYKGNTNDWRETISGTPAVVKVGYRLGGPGRGTAAELTVTPHVAAFRYRFPLGTNYQAVVLMIGDSQVTKLRWDSNTVTLLDPQTAVITLRNSKSAKSVYHYVRFSAPAVEAGTMEEATNSAGAATLTGDKIGAYFKFHTTNVIAAVSVSHTSGGQAKKYFDTEFASMDFDAAADALKAAWNRKLGRIEARGPELAMRQLYTALYSVYVNLIDATDNPYYRSYQPLLTIASSDYWQAMALYMRCDWDMSRGVYSLVALMDPELFTHIVNAYQAQYDRDGYFWPNWDPFWASGFRESLYLANFATLAQQAGVAGVDYVKLKNSIINHVETRYQSPMFKIGYVPAESKDVSSASRTLEYCTQLQGLAILARTLGDTATYEKYFHYRTNYVNVFDPENQQFRTKMSNGDWGRLRTNFFEGNGISYGFCAPHDPYGLFSLYGPSNAVDRIQRYMRHQADFNDYQLIYEFLPMYADRADVTQDLVRTAHIPKFNGLIMAEGFWPGPRGCYYTDNAGPLACCLLGLYWIPTSGGTWLLTTPSFDRVVIHGKTDLTIQASNLATNNNYISSVELDGDAYPSLQLSAKALAAKAHTLTLGLQANPARPGDLYLSSTDGEVMAATMNGKNTLDFTVDPLAASCSAQVYSAVRPAAITREGTKFTDWTYDNASHLATLKGITKGSYRVSLLR